MTEYPLRNVPSLTTDTKFSFLVVLKMAYWDPFDFKSTIDTARRSRNKCSVCSKGFPCQAALNRHMRSHSELRSFPCRYYMNGERCNKSYKKLQDRDNHEKVHYEDEDKIFQWRCKLCHKNGVTKRFKQKSNLKRHMDQHFKIRRFKCDVCDESVSTKQRLDSHLISYKHKQKVLELKKQSKLEAD